MGQKVFVPCTDEQLESLAGGGAALVPYHPDRPCWRLEPGTGSGPTRTDRGVGAAVGPRAPTESPGSGR